jgi:hypothetical protein
MALVPAQRTTREEGLTKNISGCVWGYTLLCVAVFWLQGVSPMCCITGAG